VAVHAGQFFELVGVACRVAECLGYPEVNRAEIIPQPESVSTILPARLRESQSLLPDLLKARIEKQLETFQDGDPAFD
jgi:hypothetical protein